MKKITTLFTLFLLILTAKITAQTKSDFYDVASIHDLKITFSQPNWLNLLDSNRLNGDDMLVGTVTIDGSTYDNCGISYVKSPSYQTASLHNPWLIRLNLIDKKQAHQGYKTLMISHALRDPSLVREVLSYEIMRKYMPAQRANYVNMTVNNVNKGVYVNVEAVDEPFLQRNFNYTEGSLFRCVPDVRAVPLPDCNPTNFGSLRYEPNAKCYLRNFDMQSKDGWDDLIELTRYLQNDSAVGRVLNIDRTLWFLALQNVMVNLNSYEGQFSGNYYLYRDANGQFNFMPTEMNLSFGSFKNTNGASDLDFDALVTLDPLLQVNNTMKPLISQLLKNQDNRKVYMAHIRQILADWFDNDAYKTRAEALQKMIAKSYDATAEKPYETADFQRSLLETVGKVTRIPGIVELMSKRAKFLKKYPDLLNVPPKVSDINFSNRQKFVAKTVTEFRIKAKVDNFPRRVRLFYRPVGSASTAFTEVQMLDDGKSHDVSAGDKIFGVAVVPKGFDAMEYYILAESAGGATFEPATYFNQLRKISLAELNK
jgi:spore coat protein CotH